MKKYILTIIAALGILLIPSVKAASVELPEKTDHEKVKVYLFWWKNCQHCHDLISYFSDKYVDYSDYFEFVTYESTTAENQKLISSMSEYFEDYDGQGVPLVVIGDEFHQAGFGNDGKNIIEAALKEYQNENYKDIVAEAIAKNEFNLEEQSFYSACKAMGIKCKEAKKESGLSDTVVISIIFGIIVLGFGGLVLYSRQK